MLLSELLQDFVAVKQGDDCEISDLCSDSRVVKSGALFLAYHGTKIDGREFIQQAINNGAVAIVCEQYNCILHDNYPVPVISLLNLPDKIGFIAAKFYNYPARNMRMVGITGTNGKTSCSHFLAQALMQLQISCGIVGTLGVGFPGKLQAGIHTTPDPILLQQKLHEMYAQGAQAIAMEVSSHGLAQNRAASIDFEIAVFTNLSRDHLDYHHSMESYGAAKRRLFLQHNLQHAVINSDDKFGQQLIKEFHHKLPLISYSVTDAVSAVPIIRAMDIEVSANGYSATIVSPWGEGQLQTNLLGKFNISNLLAVLAVLHLMGVPFKQALQSLEHIRPVSGRMETFSAKKRPLVVVDYAHTPDALEQVLIVLREHCRGQLWCVFGCGGDRDRGKRPLMSSIAERLSDQVIITDDNPRTEDSLAIITEIQEGLLCPWAAEVEPDRAVAIAHALDCANTNDIVLIAGKGHEDYQIVGDERLFFSDAEEVKRFLDIGITHAVN